MSHLEVRWLAARDSFGLDSTRTINRQKRVSKERDFGYDEKMRGVVHAQINFRISPYYLITESYVPLFKFWSTYTILRSVEFTVSLPSAKTWMEWTYDIPYKIHISSWLLIQIGWGFQRDVDN